MMVEHILKSDGTKAGKVLKVIYVEDKWDTQEKNHKRGIGMYP